MVGQCRHPGNPPPSLDRHYPVSSLLRGGPPLCLPSVLNPLRCLPLGGLPLAALAAERPQAGPGSHVPCKSPDQAHVSFTPDTTWPANRLLPGCSRGPARLGFDVGEGSRRVTTVRLPDPHLTRSPPPFAATLTTPALNRRSLRWFGVSPCRATPEGRPPSSAEHCIEVSSSTP
jgi:hypothetical protein